MMDTSQTSRHFGSIHAQSNLQKIQSEVFSCARRGMQISHDKWLSGSKRAFEKCGPNPHRVMYIYIRFKSVYLSIHIYLF